METKVTRTQTITSRTARTEAAEYILAVEHIDGRLTQLSADIMRIDRGTAPDGSDTEALALVGKATWRTGNITLANFPLDGMTATYISELAEIVASLDGEGGAS